MNIEIGEDTSDSGMRLRCTLQGQHQYNIWQVAWSPDGTLLASSSCDSMLCLWNVQTGHHLRNLEGHMYWVTSLAWSPDGSILASGSSDHTIRLWNPHTGKCWKVFQEHSGDIHSLAWSPDGSILASSSYDGTILLWDPYKKQSLRVLEGPKRYTRYTKRKSPSVQDAVWSPDSALLAAGSYSDPIRLWNPHTGQIVQEIGDSNAQVSCVIWPTNETLLTADSKENTIEFWDISSGRHLRTLEGHTATITDLSFSSDSRLFASKSLDGEALIWRTDTWDLVGKLGKMVTQREFNPRWFGGLAFNPASQTLARATVDTNEIVVQIWDVNVEVLLGNVSAISSVHYTNAKVVLLGESGVGKSGLSLVLTDHPFTPTESTHGRHVHVFENREIESNGQVKQVREVLLWDLAGQPDYRLIHQLHLNEVAVALLVFDPGSENDLFTGIRYWDRALRLAQQTKGSAPLPLKKFLVAARLDRSGRNVSQDRIDELLEQLDFARYVETSAKEGWGIPELAQAIREAIRWDDLPKVTSTELFYQIKQFLAREKQTGKLLCTKDELYSLFLQLRDALQETGELRSQFETCLGHVASAGLIRPLSFGDLILLQPELLDAYASALLIAAKNHTADLGNILEERVKKGDFPIPNDERITNKEQEKLLLIAMIEEMLNHEIVLREQGDLIFPSQLTREYPNLSNPEGKFVTFTFEGPGISIYTRLVVRLSNSGFFKKKELWKNAVTYTTRIGGIYGLHLSIRGEEYNELTIFFDKDTKKEMCFLFEEYVQEHLLQHSLPNSIQRKRFFVCPGCGDMFTDRQVTIRRERGFDWIRCSICDERVSIIDKKEYTIGTWDLQVTEMNKIADSQRDLETNQVSLQGKIVTKDFDVFLCYNSEDKSAVKQIGEQLKELGILPWLDDWELRPGLPWQRLLEEQITLIKSAAVFVGEAGIGPWQQEELDAFLREFTRRECPVIPVLLPGAPEKTKLPTFLYNRTWVDFRKKSPDPIEQLIWGITGNHSTSS